METTKQYGPRADLALNLWVKLARAYATFNRQTVRQIRTFGLTQPQFGVIESLGHLGPMLIGDLSRKMLVSGGNMTCVVDNLEKDGLVERAHSDTDRRAIIVSLTPRGRALFADIFPSHAEYVADLAAVLTNEEQRTLAALLKKLGTALMED